VPVACGEQFRPTCVRSRGLRSTGPAQEPSATNAGDRQRPDGSALEWVLVVMTGGRPVPQGGVAGFDRLCGSPHNLVPGLAGDLPLVAQKLWLRGLTVS